MKTRKLINILSFSGELLLLVTFGYTGVYKLIYFKEWIEKTQVIDFVRNYNLNSLTMTLPFLELLLSILLCFGRLKLIATYGMIMLLTIFTIYLYDSVYIGNGNLCPCGGIFSFLTLDWHILVNLLLIAVAIMLTIKQKIND